MCAHSIMSGVLSLFSGSSYSFLVFGWPFIVSRPPIFSSFYYVYSWKVMHVYGSMPSVTRSIPHSVLSLYRILIIMQNIFSLYHAISCFWTPTLIWNAISLQWRTISLQCTKLNPLLVSVSVQIPQQMHACDIWIIKEKQTGWLFFYFSSENRSIYIPELCIKVLNKQIIIQGE